MPDYLRFLNDLVALVVALGGILWASWGFVMRKVKNIAREEAVAIVKAELTTAMADVASKSAVEQLQASSQHVSDRIDQLFALIGNSNRRRETDR